MPAGVEEGPARLDGLLDDLAEIEQRPLDLDLAARDAGDVEQIVDEASEVPALAFDDVDAPGGVAHLAGRLAEDGDGVADRGERIAELVGQHRQELVLAAIGLAESFGRFLAIGDVDGHARHARRPVRFADLKPGDSLDPAGLAVGADDAELVAELGRDSCVEDLPALLDDAFSILGMEKRGPDFVDRVGRHRVDAVDGPHSVAPPDVAAGGVPIPDADAAGRLREPEPAFAVAKSRVRLRKLRGPFVDAAFELVVEGDELLLRPGGARPPRR